MPRSGPSQTCEISSRQQIALELEVHASETVETLKSRVAEAEGTAVEHQRLICKGHNLQNDRSLASYGICHGTSVLLVPHVRGEGNAKMTFAPRGMMMVAGNTAWEAKPPVRPHLPVLCADVSRSFGISLEFGTTSDCEAFVAAAQEEPLVLAIDPVREGQRPTEARVIFDPDSRALRLEDATGNTLAPSMNYGACSHLGGRGGEIKVTLVTGADVAGQ